MIRSLLVAALALGLAAEPAFAQGRTLTLGFAGLLDRTNRTDLPPLTLSSGKPIAEAPYELFSGGYYRIEIIADGSQELAIEGADFFRNVWIDEVVINEIEVRPLGLDSIEFDDEGAARISFIAIRPGDFVVQIRGARGDSQRARFSIR